MAEFFYTFFLNIFRAGIFVSSLWNKKAALWIRGRKNIFENLQSVLGNQGQQIIWFHCSSLGEFEQGRPLLEKLKQLYPHYKFLLTFFSPSGYEAKKNYTGSDWVFYLPLDSKKNASRFLDIVKPILVVFVKYDYWYYYLTGCKNRKIPLLMISAKFRNDQPFFRWYGSLHRKMLNCFTHFFVQDELSKLLLQKTGIRSVTQSGDTRFDRVIEIAEKKYSFDIIENFCGQSKVLVAGSTWPTDEKIIKEAIVSFSELKLILVPHEIHKEHLSDLKKLFQDSVYYSELISQSPGNFSSNCLIVDNIGMLSKLYSYATITYIGGGFSQGIHNILEAAVYGKPVIFGPRHEKFNEAAGLIAAGGGFCISDKNEMKNLVGKLLSDQSAYQKICSNAGNYVAGNKGATEKIIQYIQENLLLTRL